MFAHLTTVSIALIAMIGAVAANNNVCPLAELACCATAANSPMGYQGTGCWRLTSDMWCGSPFIKLCCNHFDLPTGVASSCMQPLKN